MKDSESDNRKILETQKMMLEMKRNRLNGIIELISDVLKGEDKMSFETFNEDDIQKIIQHSLKIMSKEDKKIIIEQLELLIIDEISMVRCDTLDVIDKILRVFRKKPFLPFGGVQVILIGDTFQLPPVRKFDEWEILKNYYESPFFFSSKIYAESEPIYIELKKIYRQKEQDFIDLLNNIRVNQINEIDNSSFFNK